MATFPIASDGSIDDRVRIVLADKETFIFETYEVHKQWDHVPSAFHVRLGSGSSAAEIAAAFPPNTKFRCLIGPTVTQFQGRLDGYSADDQHGATEVDLRGRDVMARLVDDMLTKDQSFGNTTFEQLARACIVGAGCTPYAITFSRSAMRKVVTGNTIIDSVDVAVPLVTLLGPGTAARKQAVKDFLSGNQKSSIAVAQAAGVLPTSGAGTLAVTTQRIRTEPAAQPIQGKAGRDSWWSFSHKEFERGGIFLHAGVDPEGIDEFNFVLCEPTAKQPPLYGLIRQKGQNTALNYATILSHRHHNDTAHRHASYTVLGRSTGGSQGSKRNEGTYTDPEMVGYGFTKHWVKEDKESKSAAHALYLARRHAAEERRKGWHLEYTVKGHSAPALVGTGRAVWDFDTIVRVYDDEHQIYGDFWIDSVRFRGSTGGTFTDLELRRPEDLIYGEGEFFTGPAKKKKGRKK